MKNALSNVVRSLGISRLSDRPTANSRRVIAVLSAVCVLWTVHLGCAGEVRAAGERGLRSPSRIVVVFCVPGLRADYFERFRAHLADNGLRRFEYAGARFRGAHTGLIAPELGPAYATVATGRWPRRHGVVADQWIDPASDKVRTPVNFAKAFGGAAGEDPGHALACANLTEHLAKRAPDVKVVAVGWNPVSSVLLGGRGARRVLWFNPLAGGFWGWPLVDDGPPAWMKRYAEAGFIERWRGGEWTRALPAWKYREVGKDDRPCESNDRLGATFPHALPDDAAAYHRTVGWTPFADQMVLEAAAGAILSDELAGAGKRALAWIALDSLSSVGRVFGPFSHEAFDTFVRLDRQIARFFTVLDSRFGSDQWTAVLAGLGGMPPHAERASTRGYRAAAVEGRPTLTVDDVELAHYGGGVYLRSGVTADDVRSAFEDVDGVLAVTDRAAALAGDALDDDLRIALRRQTHAERSGDVHVLLRPMARWRGLTGPRSPWSYDQRTVFMLLGQDVRAGAYPGRVTLASIAPTVARLLDVPFDATRGGSVLERALALRAGRASRAPGR